ncbi:MAG TPA: hypothetical protein VME22_20920 [Solirubrobacteraceae bacterium]|nr:hypothetical protein [Solirubrobacteraceae bacterium]
MFTPRGSLTLVISASDANERARVLPTFLIAGFAELWVPVLCLKIALQDLSPRVRRVIFAVIAGLGSLAVAPVLVRPPDANPALATSS